MALWTLSTTLLLSLKQSTPVKKALCFVVTTSVTAREMGSGQGEIPTVQ